MLKCTCSAASLNLKELNRVGLWPLRDQGSIYQVLNLLTNGSLWTFVPAGGIENCQACQPKPFTTICKEIADSVHPDSIGLDLHRWKDLDQVSIRDVSCDCCDEISELRGRKRKRRSY